MATQDPLRRVRRAVEDAVRRLECPAWRPDDRPPDPAPGDLFVFGIDVEATVEWLVVRIHPDDPAVLLLTPADDFPLAGPSDVPLQPEFTERPLTVRCGEATWVPVHVCREHLRVGVVPDDGVTLVRRRFAGLARGELPEESGTSRVDADPEYAAWMGQVARARAAVERRANATSPVGEGIILPFERFTTQPPTTFAEVPQVPLAAHSGGTLLAALAESLASAGTRFQEVALNSGGTLLLAADASGVRVAWTGPDGKDPPPLSAAEGEGRVMAMWRAGTRAGVHRAAQLFPWSDGQFTFLVGTDQPESFTVRL